jgi:hypothetical protein
MSTIGIEKLTPTIRTVAQLITALTKIDANKDGNIDTAEIFAIVQVFVMKVVAVYGSLPAALAELKDVDSTERKELVKVFNEEFDLSNDVLEGLIEEWLVIVDQLVTLGLKTASHFKTEPQA